MLTFVFISVLILLIIIVKGTSRQQPEKLNSFKKAPIVSSPNTTNRLSSKYKKEREDDLTESLLSSIRVTVTSEVEDSVIDVSGSSYKLPSEISGDVPYWPHFYVYSYQDLQRATPEQRAFYQKFRSEFLQGQNIDLQGNNNYAFILLFDLLNDFDQHKNLSLIEGQLNKLAESYPRTRAYCKQFLISRLRTMGDYQSVERINREFAYVYHPTEYDNFYYRLGDKYKTKLGLNEDQLFLVNKLWDPGNNFCSIEFCLLQTIKVYLALAEKLNSDFAQQNFSLEKELETISSIVASKQFHYRAGSYNYKYTVENTTNELYRLIFKHAENALRNHYGHKRKLTTDVFYHNDAKQAWEQNIVSKIDSFVPQVIQNAAVPDEATEIALNEQSTSRWKTVFDKIKEENGADAKKFSEKVIELGRLNKKNPSIENIFFEASKFIAKLDKEVALTLYIHYLYHDLKSATFDNKQLTKTIQKSLFKSNEELQEFEKIISELIKDKDLDKALSAIPQVYKAKRKKIKLDAAAISEVKEKHSATVDLLDDILNDDYEDEATAIRAEQVNNDEVKLDITQKSQAGEKIRENPYGLTNLQQELLEYFSKNSFALSNDEIEGFIKSRGAFKNQLIESINETCYEALDDLLIEEEEDNYIINEQYYQRILVA